MAENYLDTLRNAFPIAIQAWKMQFENAESAFKYARHKLLLDRVVIVLNWPDWLAHPSNPLWEKMALDFARNPVAYCWYLSDSMGEKFANTDCSDTHVSIRLKELVERGRGNMYDTMHP